LEEIDDLPPVGGRKKKKKKGGATANDFDEKQQAMLEISG
jgi:hypothetical protein